MENAPVISVAAFRLPPEHRERYLRWVFEAYWPLLMSTPYLKGIDTHRIVKANPQYNVHMTIFYFGSLKDLENWMNTPEYTAFVKDIEATWVSRGGRLFWSARYELLRDFTNIPSASRRDKAEITEDAPVIHLEGYALPPDEEEKYNTWFAKWGHEIYIPLLMKTPGLEKYARYKLVRPSTVLLPRIPAEYPPCLSILTFENLKAYEDYEKSLELAAFRERIDALIPSGLVFKWYVQYQLIKSWRK